MEPLLRKDIEELLRRAKQSDAEPVEDGQELPQEIARREALLKQKVDLCVAIASEDNNYRCYGCRPPKQKPAQRVVDPRLVAMRDKLATEQGKGIYGRRACSVEPVFGIIKSAMGLRQFLLRGIAKVRIEWDLTCLAYDMRRLLSHQLSARAETSARQAP